MTYSFNKQLLAYFGATQGAYSIVTATEYGDSQATVSGPERDVILSKAAEFLEDKKGSVRALTQKGVNSEYEFKLYPTGEKVRLNLIYPKPGKTELRLYFRKGLYAPSAGKNWCVFVRNDELWLGSFERGLETISPILASLNRKEQILEPEVDSYQDAVNSEKPRQKATQTMMWGRNPKTAKKALDLSGYECEIFPDLPTFIAKATGKPFLESHHLVPMKLQDKFEFSLDVVENICALNPYSHRFLHHGNPDEILDYVEKLSVKREKYLKSIDFAVKDVLRLYS